MADAPNPEAYPPPTFPTVFADGISIVSYTPHVAKFYLTRLDSGFSAGPAQTTPIAQIVMAMPGFLDTAAFFNHQIAVMLNRGVITQKQFDEANARYVGRSKT